MCMYMYVMYVYMYAYKFMYLWLCMFMWVFMWSVQHCLELFNCSKYCYIQAHNTPA